MKKIICTTKTKQKGFTLLFAILVSTLVISIGATIISVATRQTILSGTSRESQYAFYAANTALECAHFWDTMGSSVLGGKVVFPAEGTTDVGVNLGEPEEAEVNCSGVNIINGSGNIGDVDWVQEYPDSDTNKTTFYLKISDQANLGTPGYTYCAEATVTKFTDTIDDKVVTTIEAKGYNTCDPNYARRVERGLIQQYES